MGRGVGGVRRGGQGDVRGADVAAAGQRREALHVHAEQPRERPRLGLAQLRGTRARRPAPGSGPGTAAWRMPPGTGRAEAAYPSAASAVGERRGRARRRRRRRRRRPAACRSSRSRTRCSAKPCDGLRARRSRRGSAAPGWRARSSGATARPGRGWSRRTGARAVRGPSGAAPRGVVHRDLVGGLEDTEVPTDPGGREVELRGELGGGDRARRRRRSAARAGGSRRRSPAWRCPAGCGRRRQRRAHAHLRRVSSGSQRPAHGRAHGSGRDIGNILVANIHPCKQGDPSPGSRPSHRRTAPRRAP